MRCQACGAWSSVRETREADRGFTTKRTRVCANGHAFPTFEVSATVYRNDPRHVQQTVNAAEARALRAKRNAAIATACKTRSKTSVAAEFGLSRNYVSELVSRHASSLAIPRA
jgi:transcriptional regulator NrdR family protein